MNSFAPRVNDGVLWGCFYFFKSVNEILKMPKPPQQYFHMVLFLFFSIHIIRFKILIHLNWTARSVSSASGPRSVGMRMPACSLHYLRDSEACGVSFVLRCFCHKVSFSQSLPSPSCGSFSSMAGAFLVSFSVRAHGWVAHLWGRYSI